MVKVLSFKKMNKERGWLCFGEDHQAEGVLTFKNGDEIPCCFVCAKTRFGFRKNRKGWVKILDKHKVLKKPQNFPIDNQETNIENQKIGIPQNNLKVEEKGGI